MTDLRTAAQQALEALEFSTLDAFMLAPISPGRESTIKAITALRDALAEPDLSRCPNCKGPADNGHDRFAALVISHHVKETRPEVSDSMATWLQQIAYQHGGIGDLSRTEMEFGAMVAAAEREACAEVCDEEAEKWEGNDGPICYEARMCAVNIRARGEK